MQLTNRTVLITGGTSGIGLALARALRRRGNADAVARFPALDVLVNNAGLMRNLDLTRARGLADVTRELDVGLSAPVRMVQQFLPHLTARPEALVVNVTSGLAFVPFPLSPVYSAAKAGLRAYTRVLRAQLAGTPVRVVELAPLGTETPLFRGEFAEALRGQKAMDPDVLVAQAVAGIEAGKTEIRPGLSNVLKLASRVAPDLAFRQLVKEVGPHRGPAAPHSPHDTTS